MTSKILSLSLFTEIDLILTNSEESFQLRQPRSQGIFPGLGAVRGKDPGIGWSRVCLTS